MLMAQISTHTLTVCRDSIMTAAINKAALLKSNDLNDQCYCNKGRDFEQIELQCCTCARWFHRNCIEVDTGPLVRFMINYQFLCKNCNTSSITGAPATTESFTKKQASFHQLCTTALANLTAECQKEKLFFSKDRDVIPFIEKNWEAMTSAPRRTKSTWHATISRSMTREDVFVIQESQSELLYGLRDQALEKVGPYNENIKLIGTTRIVEQQNGNKSPSGSTTSGATGSLQTQQLTNDTGVSTNVINTSVSQPLTNNPNAINTQATHHTSTQPTPAAVVNAPAQQPSQTTNTTSRRGAKRKVSDNLAHHATNTTVGNSRRKAGSDVSKLEKMVPLCYPNEHPFNKDGYRYHLVEPDPHSPLRQKFEETEFWAGKPLPGHLYRLYLENRVLLAMHDRSLQLRLSEDRLCVTGDKGYTSIRATHGVRYGSWYYEVSIKDMPNNSATRIGWSQRLGNLQAPVGYDKFSYSWRSRKGTRFHASIGKTYSKDGYASNDVLGFYINLPYKNDAAKLLPPSLKDMTLVKFKNHLYYEEKDNFAQEEKSLKANSGSQIMFYKNGVCQGVAFSDIYEGVYYPAISLYKNATVHVNFGPDFKYPPDLKQYRPLSDATSQSLVEHTLSDLVYHITNDETLDL